MERAAHPETENRQEPGYRFVAVAEDLRVPFRIAAVCDTDGEASLIALSLSSQLVGVEVWQGTRLVYLAPAGLCNRQSLGHLHPGPGNA